MVEVASCIAQQVTMKHVRRRLKYENKATYGCRERFDSMRDKSRSIDLLC